ncbi:MAG: OmpA family protein, partial [Parahaliea sp.]
MSVEQGGDTETPVWAIFGDLMAALVGVFVLVLVWVIGYQVELARDLARETEQRQVEQQRRQVLEQALAEPLAAGRISLRDGRIGISGSVLFALNSADLQAEGRQLLRSLVAPLQSYLAEHDELLMVSGFTDDLPIQSGNRYFDDNWELSAQRALTVTRELIAAGMPAS